MATPKQQRKVDVLFGPGSLGARLAARRKWVEGGMQGPNPMTQQPKKKTKKKGK